jgi:multidrug resistance efflux pump
MKNLICLVLIVTFLGCTTNAPPPTPKKEVRKKVDLTLGGRIVPFKKIDVKSLIRGRVEKVLVAEGEYVEKNQVLLCLDRTSYEASLEAAEARLAIARGEYENHRTNQGNLDLMIARTKYKAAKEDLEAAKERLQEMKEAFSKGYVSQHELKAAEEEYQAAYTDFRINHLTLEKTKRSEQRLKILLSRIKEAKADLRRAKESLSHTIIKAPITGTITKINVYPGTYIFEGWPLLSIEDISSVVLEAKLSPGLLKFVEREKTLDVTVNTVPPKKVIGRLISLKKVADPVDQMCTMKILLPNPDLSFQPGFTAKVKISCVKPSQGQ